MNKNTSQFKLLTFLLLEGYIRKKDLKLFLLSTHYDSSGALKAYKNIINTGYIVEKSYTNKVNNRKSDIEVLVSLNKSGIEYMLKNVKVKYSVSKYYNLNMLPSGSTITDAIEKRLTDRGVKLKFLSLNTLTLDIEKPELSKLKQGVLNCDEKYIKLLNHGIYYDIKEVFDFLKEDLGYEIDKAYGTRVRGIYLSNYNCFSIYASKRYRNRILKLNLHAEDNFKSILKDSLSSFTNIFRKIPYLDYTNDISALVFTDGNMLMYSMATSSKRGKVRKEYKKNPRNEAFLSANSSLYDKLYAIPETKGGLITLKYLLDSTIESMLTDKTNILESSSLNLEGESVVIESVEYTPKYIPIFEAKEISELSALKGQLLVITSPDLVDAISRSIRRDIKYYDFTSNTILDDDFTYIYSKSGEILGYEMISNELKGLGKAFSSKKERMDLPKRLGFNPKNFYNSIARGEIYVKDIINEVKVCDFVPKNRRKVKNIGISISISRKTAKLLKENAKKMNISTSKYIISLINKGKSK